MKKISVILVSALVLLSLFSCNSPKEEDTVSDITTTGAEQASEAASTVAKINPDVPESNFDDYEFRILTFRASDHNVEWEKTEFTAEAETGETINDAVYRRNVYVEDKLGIKIKENHADNYDTTLRKSLRSGADDFDLCSTRLIDMLGYVTAGYFKDLQQVDYIDLKKPWYHQQSIKELSMRGRTYFVLSDALISDRNATSIIVFNKAMVKNYGLDNPYDLVKNGTWTVDKLYEMAKPCSKDLDNDQEMTLTDQWGFMTFNDVLLCFLHSGGGRIAQLNADGVPELTFNTERNYDILNRVTPFLYDPITTMNLQMTKFGGSSVVMENTFKTFSENRAAFAWIKMYSLQDLRQMESDYGILPIPKIFAEDDGYKNTMNVWQANGLSIPYTAQDIDRTAIIMESLAAESTYTVVPAYYDVCLKTKYSRDEESAEMISYIFDNRVIDIGDCYNFGSFGGNFYQTFSNLNSNYVSFYEKNVNAVNKAIDKAITLIDAME